MAPGAAPKPAVPAVGAKPAAPQATVKIGPAAPATTPSATIKGGGAVIEAAAEEPDKLTGILAIAATVLGLAALGIQAWTWYTALQWQAPM